MAPKCSQLTAIFVHLHMKARGMNRRGGREALRPMTPAREHGPHANGRNDKKSGLLNLFMEVLLKGSVTDF